MPRAGRTTSANPRPSSHGGSNQEFHRGLVSALQDVLRQQRQGIFPTPAGYGDTELSTSGTYAKAPGRPSTRGGAMDDEFPPPPTAHAQPRGDEPAANSGSDSPCDEQTPSAAAATARPPRGRGSFRRSRPDSRSATAAPAATAARENLLSAASIQILRSIERNEAFERRSLGASCEHAWDGLMKEETEQAVIAAVSGSSHSNTHLQHGSTVGATRSVGSASLRLNRRLNSIHNVSDEAIASVSSVTGSAQDATALRNEGNGHYAARRFAQAHRSYSLAMEHEPSNVVLLTNRAASSTMLLNYDACVRDCLRATTIDQRCWKAYARMARAYALLGQHQVAARHYTTALMLLEHGSQPGGGEAAVPAADLAAKLEQLSKERGELHLLERGRLEAEAGHHSAALGLYQKAATFTDEPPVRLCVAQSQIFVNPAAARAELTKYLAALEHPSTYASP
jgi:tetratricopeptide (TPR) repeat protein